MSISLGYVTTSDGARLFYAREGGEGTPLVSPIVPAMIPVAAQLNLPPDAAFVRGKAGGHPWVLFDWRGKGRSSPLTEPLCLEHFIIDLEAITSVVGAPCELHSRSRGAALAMAFAARHPAMVTRVLLEEVRRDITLTRYEHAWARMWHQDPLVAMRDTLRLLFGHVDAAILDQTVAEWHAAVSFEYAEAVDGVLDHLDLVELGRGLDIPVLITFETHEREVALEFADAWPNARLAAVDDRQVNAANGEELRSLFDHFCPVTSLTTAAGDGRAADLSARELEVLALVAEGCSNAAIGERLVISPNTAARHVATILSKLGMHSRAQAAAYAASHGLAEPPKD